MHSPEEPSMKMPRVEDEKDISLNTQSKWILEKILGELSVPERLRMERVDRFWKATAREYGLTGLRELSYEVVFEGAVRVRQERFTNKSLVALFKRARKGLLALDLRSFRENRLSITVDICASLNLLPDLYSIDILGFNLFEAVPFLPTSLCEIRSSGPSGPFNQSILSALAAKCPNLEGISLETSNHHCGVVAVYIVNTFLNNYPCLKRLRLSCHFMLGSGPLTSIGKLKELEEVVLWDRTAVAFYGVAFQAMVDQCKNLRKLAIMRPIVSENALCQLGKMSNLVELVLSYRNTNVTDKVVKAISKSRNLKKLDISFCERVTDDSVIDLVRNCKSLVSLNVKGCRRVSRKSLEAIVAEVERRYGDPPKKLPKGLIDKGIFYFQCMRTAIDWRKAQKKTAKNPWLTVEYSRELAVRSF